MRLHDYSSSGNCFKVRLALAQLGIPYERVPVDIFNGDTLTDEFGELNPARTTPVLETDDGHVLIESNAIVIHLAEGSELYPDDSLERAEVLRWLFYEQAEVMPGIGTPRVRVAAGLLEPGSPAAERALAQGGAALGVLETHLRDRSFLVGDRYTLADLCVYGYSHVADEAGFDLAEHPAVSAWIERVEATPGHMDDLAPIPPQTRLGMGRSIYG
jgi:glutathione S-transferase